MMAAATAGKRGLDVTLIEKNEKLGKKIYLTGKGRCNVTNNADIEDLIANVPTNGKFLYSAFYTFTNQDLINLLNNLGLKLKIERGNRVFPESNKSSDVIKDPWRNMCAAIMLRCFGGEVSKIEVEKGRVIGVLLKDGSSPALQERYRSHRRHVLSLYRLYRRWISLCKRMRPYCNSLIPFAGAFGDRWKPGPRMLRDFP
jgi:predicted flavoprotein YhiN